MAPRSLAELTDIGDPAWPDVQRLMGGSPWTVRVLPRTAHRAEKELLALQVSLRSVLGASIWHTGGMLIDHGWLRVFGSGSEELAWTPSRVSTRLGLGDANTFSMLAVASDVIGGLFALANAEAPGVCRGDICYLAPDSLDWQPLGCGYEAWLTAMLSARLAEFAADLRWQGWESECDAVRPADGIAIYPPLWASESRPIERTARRSVPLEELWVLALECRRQMGEPK
jgi:hypothetical protein